MDMAGKKQKSVTDKRSELAHLQVIDQLEVGPVKVEKNRLVAPYTVYNNGKKDSIDLIYKYEEDVFFPDEGVSESIANMVAAQVAMNYGLFCSRIVFHGLFDSQDRRFIREMTENTSREIYVMKLLMDNPFLIREKIDIPVVVSDKYTQATISFEAGKNDKDISPWKFWEHQQDQYAVLSSGGKDSLLSYGLLEEMGKQAHPIFVNESGRHWFTALNSYRYFKDRTKNTVRVWTNADRVFNWMLRHLPFIRQDFQNVRSDEYPIRLWTVAVFLFGAIPLMHKRRIGRLIIGDEFDTTVRAAYKGIPHYSGLYDQSKYFDSALTRYFLAKGWAIAQFSLLRPLSEMLILKILAKRYPHLHEHQVSCHSAHVEDDRVYPCGNCEKCRRIVGMLTAIDVDPANCGYTRDQVNRSLESLVRNGVHQESEGQDHLLYLLKKKKKIKTQSVFEERPEIMNMRFDPECAPFDYLPVDLRKPLYGIFMKYSLGALKRKGKKWHKIDINNDPDLIKPFPFEAGLMLNKQRSEDKMSSNYVLGEMTWPEAEAYLKKVDVALLPVGAIEQHGPHLPLDTDSFDADYLARQVAQACSDPKPIVLPPIAYGVSYHHDDFKGTFSINNDTLSRLIYEIGLSAAHNGIKKLVIINGHGGNGPSLNFAAQMINRDAHIFVSVDSGETSDVDIYSFVETQNDVHAGEFETSTSLAIRPELVQMDKADPSIPKFSSRYLNFTSKRGVSWYAYTKKISSTGVMGDPTKASAEKGRKMWQIMVAHLVAFVEDLKHLSIEEIHQKRY